MINPDTAELVLNRINELKRIQREAAREQLLLEQGLGIAFCADEARAETPNVFGTYDRQSPCGFGLVRELMRKAGQKRRSRKPPPAHRPRKRINN